MKPENNNNNIKVMKKKNYLCIMLMTASVLFGLSSCLDDDDNKPKELSSQEKETILRNLSGDYQGKLHFYNPGHLDGKDSLDVSWSVEKDGFFECNNFPVAFLAHYVSSTSEEYKILSSAPTSNYRATMAPIQKESSQGSMLYRCTFRPQTSDYSFSIDYQGSSYNVSVSLVNVLTRTDGSATGSNYAAISDHMEITSGTQRVMRMWGYILLDKMTINSQTVTINDYALFSGRRI